MAVDSAHHEKMRTRPACSTDPKMQQLRDKMQSLGLDINDASNGIWLPELGKDRLPGSTLTAHKGEGVHGQGYMNSVHETLIGAQNREEFMAGLESIKSRLSVGTTFPLGCCCRLKAKP